MGAINSTLHLPHFKLAFTSSVIKKTTKPLNFKNNTHETLDIIIKVLK